jgi:hypothetical protein
MHRAMRHQLLRILSLVALSACYEAAPVAAPPEYQAPPPSPLAHPPPDPGAASPALPPGVERAFAIRAMDWGTGSPPSPNAWKKMGFDLDGQATTAQSLGTCALLQGTPRSEQVDGDDGTDNSFAENLLPLLQWTMGSDVNDATNAVLAAGGATNVIAFDGSGTGTFLVAAPVASPPGTDAGPAAERAADVTMPELTLSHVYVAGNVVVAQSGDGDGKMWLGLPPGGQVPLAAPITHVEIVIQLDGGAGTLAGATTIHGTIAGILPTDALVTAMRPYVMGEMPDATADRVDGDLNEIAQASDIHVSQEVSPETPCDGVSFGVTFTADAVDIVPR